MSYEDELEWEAWIESHSSSPFIKEDRPKRKATMKRKTRYVKPGVTEVTYPHRILTYRFKQSQEEYDRARHLRRVYSGQKGGKAPHTPRGSYASASGLSYGQKATKDKYGNLQARKAAKLMDTGDMRALLKDEHWEEVCGHKRWMTDSKSLIKEYTKYLNYKKGRY